jgi:hypothetical protein
LAAAIAATDWQSLDAQTDADILRNVADDTDAAPILAGRETAASMANRANPSTCRKPTRR